MKKIIIGLVLTSLSLMAIDGAELYKKRCASCHGAKAQKSPHTGVPALAGRDVSELALTIRAYRDQDERVGTYTMHKDSRIMYDATSSLSRDKIVALAKYISGLK
ncbi:MAG: cytochrome c [Epsilonproteobacteria bacterium]|nr:MAG: cytochrome c [Campylobacterota bacterium]